MLNNPIDSLLFIDIETVSQHPDFNDVPATWQDLWAEKVTRILPEEETPESFYPKRAAIMAEFGKIICISAGYIKMENGAMQLRVKSFYGEDEKELLQQVIASFDQWQRNKKGIAFCGHNIKEFDIPYVCRRLLVNGMSVPNYLDFMSMKPWETNIVDTMALWKFGDFKNYTTLKLMAACLGVPSPKDDIDGSMVGDVYWKEKDLKRISGYCQKDVVTVAQLVLRIKNQPLLQEDQIVLVND